LVFRERDREIGGGKVGRQGGEMKEGRDRETDIQTDRQTEQERDREGKLM